MTHESLRVIREEHSTLAAMLQSLMQLVRRGPAADGQDDSARFFDVLRAMLFYIDEFPEKHHHPKESDLLFPRVARVAPHAMATIDQLERDHRQGEGRVRELMHLLMAGGRTPADRGRLARAQRCVCDQPEPAERPHPARSGL